MNNLDIQILYANLHRIIEESNLPVGIALFIVKDLQRELEEVYGNIVKKEYEQKTIEEERARLEAEEKEKKEEID